MDILCSICERVELDAIFQHRELGAGTPAFDLGTYESILGRATSCPLCRAFVEYINEHHQQDLGSIPHLKLCHLGSAPRWTKYFAACGYHDAHLELLKEKYDTGTIQVTGGAEQIARLRLAMVYFNLCRLYDDSLPRQSQQLRERV